MPDMYSPHQLNQQDQADSVQQPPAGAHPSDRPITQQLGKPLGTWFLRRLRRRTQPAFLGSDYRDCVAHTCAKRPAGRETERKFCRYLCPPGEGEGKTVSETQTYRHPCTPESAHGKPPTQPHSGVPQTHHHPPRHSAMTRPESRKHDCRLYRPDLYHLSPLD